jgi:2-hydroxycyclohexanecarboxyl-CoA dehydrogenase
MTTLKSKTALVTGGGSGLGALAVQADVTSADDINAALTSIRQKFGPIAILVNNAAIEDFTPFADIDEARWDEVMAVKL